MSFAQASAVHGSDGRWLGTIPDGWDIRGITNDGFTIAMATRAMEAESHGRELISATGNFVNPATNGPVEIVVEALKSGRSLSTMTATVSREGKSLVHVTGVYAHPDRPKPDDDLVLGGQPELPAPDDCIRATPADDSEFPPPLTGNIDLRVHPDDASALEELPGDRPLIRGWFRLLDEEPIDGHQPTASRPPSSTPLTRQGGPRPSNSPFRYAIRTHRDGSPAASRPDSSPGECWRRTANSGTRTAVWSPSPASSPSSRDRWDREPQVLWLTCGRHSLEKEGSRLQIVELGQECLLLGLREKR